MGASVGRVLTGQLLLIGCCVLYLIWWSVSYRPGISVDRVGGLNGILLLATAVCGITGLVKTISGVGRLSISSAKLNGTLILVIGIMAYFGLLFVTRIFFHRVVTTELILIVGWTILEVYVINGLNGSGCLTDGRFFVLAAVIAAASITSIFLYVMYYRMDEMKAFYAAMVPLITEAISMGILVALVKAQ